METSRDQTVLVLEDEALIAIYLEELLAQAGFDSISTYRPVSPQPNGFSSTRRSLPSWRPG